MAPSEIRVAGTLARTDNLEGGARKRASTPVPRAKAVSQETGSSTVPTVQDAVEQKVHAKALSEKVLRAGFLRKVYGILAAQMMLTVGVAVMCMYIQPVQQGFLAMFSSGSLALQLAMFVPTLLSLLALKLGAKDHFPANYILLFVFTLSQAVNVGYVCTVYEAAGLGYLVLTAFALTCVIFIALTLYTLLAGEDMSYMRGFLVTSLVCLSVAGVLAVFVPQLRGNIVLSALGALTFCGYIMFDTWRLEKQFSYDDYIPATIELYLDIINLFFYILRMLGYFGKKNNKK